MYKRIQLKVSNERMLVIREAVGDVQLCIVEEWGQVGTGKCGVAQSGKIMIPVITSPLLQAPGEIEDMP